MSVTVLLVSEDSSEATQQAVQTLAKKMLLVVQAHASHRVGWPRLPAEHHKVRVANAWRSTLQRDQYAIVELRRALGRHVVRDDSSFVIFHVDADVVWSSRDGRAEQTWRERVIDPVRHLLTKNGVPSEAIERAVQRILLLCPHYSIEAWVYQNTREATRICRDEHGGADAGAFERWGADRALLDEVHKPKEQTVLRDRHNDVLAGPGFPIEEVYDAQKSFAAAMDGLAGSQDLVSALKRIPA